MQRRHRLPRRRARRLLGCSIALTVVAVAASAVPVRADTGPGAPLGLHTALRADDPTLAGGGDPSVSAMVSATVLAAGVTSAVCASVFVEGLDDEALDSSTLDLRAGRRGEVGPVLASWPLRRGAAPAPWRGGACRSLDAGLVDRIESDPAAYHWLLSTAAAPGGVVRGPLDADPGDHLVAALSGPDLVPAGPNAGFGDARLDLVAGYACWDLSVQGADGPVDLPAAMRVVRAAPGTVGPTVWRVPVERGLQATGASYSARGCVPADDVVLPAVFDDPGDHAIVVDTAAAPQGAWRGQLDRRARDVVLPVTASWSPGRSVTASGRLYATRLCLTMVVTGSTEPEAALVRLGPPPVAVVAELGDASGRVDGGLHWIARGSGWSASGCVAITPRLARSIQGDDTPPGSIVLRVIGGNPHQPAARQSVELVLALGD